MVCQNPFPPFSLGAGYARLWFATEGLLLLQSRDQSAKAIEPQRHASH
jgi:hypothetical protein